MSKQRRLKEYERKSFDRRESKMERQRKFKCEDVEYTFQRPPMRDTVKMRDRCKDSNGELVEEKYYDEIMKHVIVEPKFDWEHWDEHEGFQEVMSEAIKFCNKR